MYVYLISDFIGQNKSYYSIFPATERNTGRYYCQVKNHYGSVDSETAMVYITTLAVSPPSSESSRFAYPPLPESQTNKRLTTCEINDPTPSES